MRLPERQFPAESVVGQWAGERLRCGEWDAWLPELRTCLPRSRRVCWSGAESNFGTTGVEAARDLRQPDFLPLIATALSSLDSGVWESLLHDSTSPKLLMQHIRDEVLSRGFGVVGHIPIPADIWERYVPESFGSLASRHFSGVGPPSDEAAVMVHALRWQAIVPPSAGVPGSERGSFCHRKNA